MGDVSSDGEALKPVNDNMGVEDGAIEPDRTMELLYKVEDVPPLAVTLISAVQIAATSVPFCMTMSVLVGSVVCADAEMMTKLTSSTFLMAGICTLLQTIVGVRLPIYQAPNGVFLVPILNMASLPEWKCPSNWTEESPHSSTNGDNVTFSDQDGFEILTPIKRIQMFQGGLLVASIIHMVLGGSGLMGWFKKYIGPLTIAPTIGLVGVVIIKSAIKLSSTHWGITFFTMLVFLALTLHLNQTRVPVPTWSRANGCRLQPYPVFQVYAVVISVMLGWLLSWILTAAGALTDDPEAHEYRARTDAKFDAIERSNWFYLPYPGQFGSPIFSLSIFIGMLLAVLMSIVESIGDYITAARICGVPRPPSHAITRGLFVEGFGSVISALLGTSHGTTSSSPKIGIISLTKVGSRIIYQLGAFLLILMGVCGKMSAVFVTMPDAVIGGTTIVGMAGITGVALSSLHSVNLKLSRNFMTLGLSLIMGIFVPEAIQSNPAMINTGIRECDQVLKALLANGPCVGGLIGFFLDNTLPGERSQHKETCGPMKDSMADDKRLGVYDLPWLPRTVFKRKWTRYIPFLPHHQSNAFANDDVI